jgi:uncharacterized protein (DUF2235 family)
MPEVPAVTKPASKKRLALFLDGTWKTADDNTNVWQLKSLCSPKSADGSTTQLAYYEIGVSGFLGLLFGLGLDKNITDAYEWLIDKYKPGNEIFIFGFSRGAYAARSLAGYIAKCGLLNRGAPLGVKQLYERYRRNARTIWKILGSPEGATDPEEQWIVKYSQAIPIKFVGVWDTVGTLGIPWFHIPGISRSTLGFLDTGLSRPIENGFHALAIDEHRAAFPPTLWTVEPMDSNTAIKDAPPKRPLTSVEQRWFVGSHDNIGGGRKNDPLAKVPLRWIMKKALLHGLAFQNDVDVDADVLEARIYDSYSDFGFGIYARFSSPYFRPIGEPPKEQSDGTHTIVNETIDASVFQRLRNDPGYCPHNLVEWASRHGVDIAALKNSVRADKPTEVVPD